MPIDLGPVRVRFIYYATPQELFYMLRQLETSHDEDPLAPGSVVVLAVPDQLRRFMGWPEKTTPKPAIYGDTIVFRRG
jgi:hypothetical protein